jgi:hypothetical protein
MDSVHSLRVSSKNRISGTGADFAVQLPQNLELGPQAVAQVTGVTFPISFWTVNEGVNDRLYFTLGDGQAWRAGAAMQFAPGNYDIQAFCDALKTKLDIVAGTTPLHGLAWTVTARDDGRVSVAWGAPEDTTPRRFWFLSQAELLAGVEGAFEPTRDSRLINDAVGLLGSGNISTESGEVLTFGGLYNSLFCNVVYIHSNLTTFSSLGPHADDRDVIARVPVSVSYGFVNHWQPPGVAICSFPVSNFSQSVLRFRLTNDVGQVLDLHGGNVEIEIEFAYRE